MDYTKIAQAKGYLEAVTLLKPLIERFEKLDNLYSLSVDVWNGKSVNLNVVLKGIETSTILNIYLYKEGYQYVSKNKDDVCDMKICYSNELDGFIENFFAELGND